MKNFKPNWARSVRAGTLNNRRAAAEAAFSDAKFKLQRHNLEAELDADDKARAKLEAAVAASALTRNGYADALAEVQTTIADAEQKLTAERSVMERKAASEKLAHDLDALSARCRTIWRQVSALRTPSRNFAFISRAAPSRGSSATRRHRSMSRRGRAR